MKQSEIIFTLGRITSDLICIFVALMLAYFLRMVWFDLTIIPGITWHLFQSPTTLFPFGAFLSFSIKFTFVIIFILAIQGRYRFDSDEKVLDEFIHIFWGISAGMTLLLVYFFFAQFDFFSRLIFGMSWIFSIVFILGGRLFLRFIRRIFYLKGFGKEKILILGVGDLSRDIIAHLRDLP